jgi:hypothetical protein
MWVQICGNKLLAMCLHQKITILSAASMAQKGL